MNQTTVEEDFRQTLSVNMNKNTWFELLQTKNIRTFKSNLDVVQKVLVF